MANEQAKAIFITGGASGIGRAVAQRFAREDWLVGLADVDAKGLKESAALLPEGCASTHVMDVRDPDGWHEELTLFTQRTGRLDVLFNNAGIALGGPFAQTGLDDLERIIAINFTGVVLGARIGHAFLKDTPGSCLLNTASAAALYGTSGGAIYSATKFAVRGLTEALDGEWAADAIKVRSLMPSFIDTPLLDKSVTGSNEQVRDRVKAAGLEFTPVEEVADTAWRAVHDNGLHHVVGKTARRLKFASRWMPGKLRKMARRQL
ncbi:SDR family oxidoreductase [Stakelama sediminis]|uniref:NAD(P)-dependent dehydrogenase (Short-subunit alcohol dehydrogenase family) n=1 Tax=Stakelama sediminis TaxID=463200 RepID=A0A840YW81_9SPHN|nr:SDR family oxidoreductase [Stakelama sediminis]MBB5717893.1 NAD(P)-dependent dehydrogenase (short-subunit alcohol dehydrogenase family) [Stakelama sediminis]